MRSTRARAIELSERHTASRAGLSRLGQFARQKPLGLIGLVILLVMLFAAVFGPAIAPYDPILNDASNRLLGPSVGHFFGTDHFGRDVFSRVLVGARTSIAVGVIASFFGNTIGALLGLLSGYFGGKLDLFIQRLADMKMAFPTLILALALIAVLGPSTRNVIIAISVAFIPGSARIVRSAVLSIRQQPYVEAVRSIGAADIRIVFRHILPNAMAPYLVLLTLDLGVAIIVEASLSFLGLGSPPPAPTWGSMLSAEGRRYLENAPWISLFPGAAISLTVFGINVFGDALRDILDPRLRTT